MKYNRVILENSNAALAAIIIKNWFIGSLSISVHLIRLQPGLGFLYNDVYKIAPAVPVFEIYFELFDLNLNQFLFINCVRCI